MTSRTASQSSLPNVASTPFFCLSTIVIKKSLLEEPGLGGKRDGKRLILRSNIHIVVTKCNEMVSFKFCLLERFFFLRKIQR